MADIIQIRRDTASNWTSTNPTLASGELGLETDTSKIKVGNGSTNWAGLSYWTLGTAGFAPLANPTFTGTVAGPTINATTQLQIGGTNVLTTINSKAQQPTLKGANYTMTSWEFIIASAGSITLTLPASPSAGDNVTVKDGTGAAATTNFTVARNSSKIASSATDLTFDKNWAEITMTYINSTIGWSV